MPPSCPTSNWNSHRKTLVPQRRIYLPVVADKRRPLLPATPHGRARRAILVRKQRKAPSTHRTLRRTIRRRREIRPPVGHERLSGGILHRSRNQLRLRTPHSPEPQAGVQHRYRNAAYQLPALPHPRQPPDPAMAGKREYTWLGPTKLKVSLVWLINRKTKK